jgi:hypothetical protein
MLNLFKIKVNDQLKNAAKDIAKIVRQESGEFVKSAAQQTIAPEAGSIPQQKTDTSPNPIVEAMQQQTNPNTPPPNEGHLESQRTQRLNYLQQELSKLEQQQKYEQQQKQYQAMQQEKARQEQIKAQQESGLVMPQGKDNKGKAKGGGKSNKAKNPEMTKKVGG